jgi:arylsulfatase A-like enzyme
MKLQLLLQRLVLVLITTISILPIQKIQAQAPNFVVILVDDQGWTGTSVQMIANDASSKSDYYETPNLEQMAQNGMIFSQAYAPAAKCSPSRNSILTGQSTARAKFHITDVALTTGEKLVEADNRNTIDDTDTTIGEWLKSTSLNYQTAHYGKWHLGNGGPANHGFDYGSGNTDNNDGDASDGLTVQSDPKSMYALTDSAVNFMTRAQTAGNPFYVQISHYAVHTALEARQHQLDQYADNTIRPKGTNHTNETYGAMTENLDSAVGLLLTEIANLGLTGNTYIIYTSDNGASRGKSPSAPLKLGKTFIYEGGIRVPFIIQGPGITANTRSSEPIIGYDLFPTIAQLSGASIAMPTLIDGQDISSVWTGGGFARSKNLYFHIPHYDSNNSKKPNSAIVDGNYKLIIDYETGNNYLFDLSTDIGEATDVSGSNTTQAESMRKELRDHFEEVDANMPSLDPTHADFSGSGSDVDNDGLDDAWELRRTLTYTYLPTDNVDNDIATLQEEHDYNSDPLTDEGLSAMDATLSDTSIYILESYGDTSINIVLPVNNSTGGDLTINYTISGTATSGVDFTALSGNVIIPDGGNKKTITISLLDDLVQEGNETIILTLNTSGGNTLGAVSEITITIADNECTQQAVNTSLNNCNTTAAGAGLTVHYVETTDTVADTRTITSSGVPNHAFRAKRTPVDALQTKTMDLTPALNSQIHWMYSPRPNGAFGNALNGVFMFPIAAEPFVNPNTGQENWSWLQDFVGSPGNLNADCNYAHINGRDLYHYHGDMVEYANLLLPGLGDGTTTPTYPIQIGWAADGFPIYYKYGYSNPTDSTSGIKLYGTNYNLKTGSRNGDGITEPCGTYNGYYIQDNEYNTANGGDLDECNGIYGVTREFPSGTYYYVITRAFPSIPRCLKGTPSADYYTGTVLPIELLNFTGTVQDNQNVLLEWVTSTEINNQGFELQKSINGYDWETLNFIAGAGNSTGLINYSYLDDNVTTGEIYYRLKQIDFDGSSENSMMIVVEISTPDIPFTVYPNPTSGDLNYFLESHHSIKQINIFSSFGRLIRQQNIINGTIQTRDLDNGIYFLIVELDNGQLIKERIVKY